jgi:8-oxo-dGTP pyrophosphatase MutT (NUDIX family)
MDEDAFRTVVKGLIEHGDEFLIGQKESVPGHPISERWHLLGGHLEPGEDVDDALRREIKEETGLSVTVKQLVDVMTFSWDEPNDSLQILFHCVADSKDATPQDDLQELQWVSPEQLPAAVHDGESRRLRENPRQAGFLDSLQEN